MAIDLVKLSTDRIEFGDIPVGGLTAVTVALTIRLNAAPLNETAMHKGTTFPDHVLLYISRDTDEMAFIAQGAGIARYSRKTTGLNMVNGSLYRMISWWTAPQNMEIWVNGAVEPTVVLFSGAPAALRVSTASLNVGRASDLSTTTLGAEYSELAVWDHRVPDWFLEAYGKGLSPDHYRKGGILYSRMKSLRDLDNRWGRFERGVNVGGTNVAHPRMFYPPLVAKRRGLPSVPFGFEQEGQTQPIFPPNEVVPY